MTGWITRRRFLGGTLAGVAAAAGTSGVLQRGAGAALAPSRGRGPVIGGPLPPGARVGAGVLMAEYTAAGRPGGAVVAANTVSGSVTALNEGGADLAAIDPNAFSPRTSGRDFTLHETDPIGGIDWFDGLAVGEEIVAFGKTTGGVQETRGTRPLYRVVTGKLESIAGDRVQVDGASVHLHGATQYWSMEEQRFLDQATARSLLRPGIGFTARGRAQAGYLSAVRVLIE